MFFETFVCVYLIFTASSIKKILLALIFKKNTKNDVVQNQSLILICLVS